MTERQLIPSRDIAREWAAAGMGAILWRMDSVRASDLAECRSCRGRGWVLIRSRRGTAFELADGTRSECRQADCLDCGGTGRAAGSGRQPGGGTPIRLARKR